MTSRRKFIVYFSLGAAMNSLGRSRALAQALDDPLHVPSVTDLSMFDGILEAAQPADVSEFLIEYGNRWESESASCGKCSCNADCTCNRNQDSCCQNKCACNGKNGIGISEESLINIPQYNDIAATMNPAQLESFIQLRDVILQIPEFKNKSDELNIELNIPSYDWGSGVSDRAAPLNTGTYSSQDLRQFFDTISIQGEQIGNDYLEQMVK